MTSYRSAAVLAAAFFCLFSAAVAKGKGVDPALLQSMHQIVVVGPSEPDTPFVSTKESREEATRTMIMMGGGVMPFLIGHMIARTPMEKRVAHSLSELQMGVEVRRAVMERLKLDGYEVGYKRIEDHPTNSLIRLYFKLKFPGDGVVDLAIGSVGFHDMNSIETLCPALEVKTRFLAWPSRKKVFTKEFQYLCGTADKSSVLVPVDAKYQIKDQNVLLNNPALANEALMTGVALIAEAIAKSIADAKEGAPVASSARPDAVEDEEEAEEETTSTSAQAGEEKARPKQKPRDRPRTTGAK